LQGDALDPRAAQVLYQQAHARAEAAAGAGAAPYDVAAAERLAADLARLGLAAGGLPYVPFLRRLVTGARPARPPRAARGVYVALGASLRGASAPTVLAAVMWGVHQPFFGDQVLRGNSGDAHLPAPCLLLPHGVES